MRISSFWRTSPQADSTVFTHGCTSWMAPLKSDISLFLRTTSIKLSSRLASTLRVSCEQILEFANFLGRSNNLF
jgi:hypothetical protein